MRGCAFQDAKIKPFNGVTASWPGRINSPPFILLIPRRGKEHSDTSRVWVMAARPCRSCSSMSKSLIVTSHSLTMQILCYYRRPSFLPMQIFGFGGSYYFVFVSGMAQQGLTSRRMFWERESLCGSGRTWPMLLVPVTTRIGLWRNCLSLPSATHASVYYRPSLILCRPRGLLRTSPRRKWLDNAAQTSRSSPFLALSLQSVRTMTNSAEVAAWDVIEAKPLSSQLLGPHHPRTRS